MWKRVKSSRDYKREYHSKVNAAILNDEEEMICDEDIPFELPPITRNEIEEKMLEDVADDASCFSDSDRPDEIVEGNDFDEMLCELDVKNYTPLYDNSPLSVRESCYEIIKLARTINLNKDGVKQVLHYLSCTSQVLQVLVEFIQE
ncbi:unnamed protein product [Didymodactylos carnosus]|uniref:Uncharacterized protein n=1 Tax=Didymodactylos carnosus TaxID=1234261 RepID=A0A816BLX8_9BILA|nr:unnamed protein product [Didymodactylos carnosus]CAF1610838.1 unnamed protein product [Didymodactylos carnosus]CAF4235491.1 unnamed protein product [Didymodactylos carnosus]CAF4493687.1 unnamed protein product [Didymodactylos carnosus]